MMDFLSIFLVVISAIKLLDNKIEEFVILFLCFLLAQVVQSITKSWKKRK